MSTSEEKDTEKTRRSIREGLLTSLESDGRLVGSKCGDCNQIYFPKLDGMCFQCLSETHDDVVLSNRGTLYSFTTCMVPTRRYKPPYITGFVELPEGVRVFCQMEKDADSTSLKVGMPVTLNVATAWETDDEIVVAYRFTPDQTN